MKINKIENVDCLIYLKKIPKKSVDLILIDPPYFNVLKKDWKGKNIKWDSNWKNIYKYMDWVDKWLLECKRVLKDNGSLYIFCDSKNQAYTQILADKLFKLKNIISWIKPNSLQKKGWHKKYHYSNIKENILYYSNMYDIDLVNLKYKYKISSYIDQEMTKNKIRQIDLSKLFPSITGGITGCVSNWRKGLNIICKKQYLKIQNYCKKNKINAFKKKRSDFITTFNQKNNYTNIWKFNMTQSTDKTFNHPTQKPISIIKRIIKTSSNKNDIILDFFMGSGTTAIVCLKEKRNFIGCEIDKKYFEKSKKRIKEFYN